MIKSNKIVFVVWEILYWNALNHLLKYHLLHGKKSSWKKSSTYFYILGHVVYAMSIRQIRQQHKEKSRNTIKMWLCRQLMWQPWTDLTQSMTRPNLWVTAVCFFKKNPAIFVESLHGEWLSFLPRRNIGIEQQCTSLWKAWDQKRIQGAKYFLLCDTMTRVFQIFSMCVHHTHAKHLLYCPIKETTFAYISIFYVPF